MKTFLSLLLLTVSSLMAPVIASAESPDSGFFLSGAGSVQIFTGTGTWDGIDFNMQEPLSTDSPVGFSWTDRLVLGVKPMVGYRLNSRFSVQLGMGLNIAKSSQQTYSELVGYQYYEQGYSAEWQQRMTEALLVMHTESNLNFYGFVGVERADIKMRVTLYEGGESYNGWGDLVSTGESRIEEDNIWALGFLIGGGVEFPSGTDNSAVFMSAQYSVTKTDDTLFGTPDFKVDVGGLTALIGIKWFPFHKSSP